MQGECTYGTSSSEKTSVQTSNSTDSCIIHHRHTVAQGIDGRPKLSSYAIRAACNLLLPLTSPFATIHTTMSSSAITSCIPCPLSCTDTNIPSETFPTKPHIKQRGPHQNFQHQTSISNANKMDIISADCQNWIFHSYAYRLLPRVGFNCFHNCTCFIPKVFATCKRGQLESA